MKGLAIISLTTVVNAQYDLGNTDLDKDDFYLFDKDRDALLKNPVEFIRGWLYEILVARGDFPSARWNHYGIGVRRRIWYLTYLILKKEHT